MPARRRAAQGPRSQLLSLLLVTLVSFSLAAAAAQDDGSGDNPFNCHLSIDWLTYDLSSLAGEQVLQNDRLTPPTRTVDIVRFDLCEDLKPEEGVAEQDQCPSGSRACLKMVNQKAGEDDRIIRVVPLGQSSSLNPEYSAISSPRGLGLVFHGPQYPDSSDSSPWQSISFTFICAAEASRPTFSQYDGQQVKIEWSTPAGCGFTRNKEPQNDDSGGEKQGNSDQRMGSGISWFFLVLLLSFAAYFALGAYYNYSTYGARGSDLIPHKDFWREVPYMCQDVIAHLCSAARPRRLSSRGGYIAV